MKTELKNRILYFDGANQVDPDLVPYLFLHGIQPEKIVVAAPSDDIDLFNSLSDTPLSSEKTCLNEPSFQWLVPEKYLSIDLDAYVLERARARGPKYEERAEKELAEIRNRDLVNLFKTLIYVVDTFKSSSTTWGVGRGSSCASLVLHLIGLHMVDPVMFNISLEEFFHD